MGRYVHSSCPGSHPSRVFKNGHWQSCEPRTKNSGGNENDEEIQDLKDKIKQMKEKALDGDWKDTSDGDKVYIIRNKKVKAKDGSEEVPIYLDDEDKISIRKKLGDKDLTAGQHTGEVPKDEIIWKDGRKERTWIRAQDGGDEDGGDDDLKKKIKDLEKVIKEKALDGRWIDKKQENNPLEDTTIYTIKDKKVTDGKVTEEITISEDPDKDPAIKIEKFPKLKDETEEEDAEQQQEVTDWEADHQALDKNEIKWKKPADTTWIRLKDKQIEELKKKIKEGGDKDKEIDEQKKKIDELKKEKLAEPSKDKEMDEQKKEIDEQKKKIDELVKKLAEPSKDAKEEDANKIKALEKQLEDAQKKQRRRRKKSRGGCEK